MRVASAVSHLSGNRRRELSFSLNHYRENANHRPACQSARPDALRTRPHAHAGARRGRADYVNKHANMWENISIFAPTAREKSRAARRRPSPRPAGYGRKALGIWRIFRPTDKHSLPPKGHPPLHKGQPQAANHHHRDTINQRLQLCVICLYIL